MLNKFIVIEGIDGVGKSTVGSLLAEQIGAFFFQTPPNSFSSTRDIIDKSAKVNSRFFFYLASVTYTSEIIQECLKEKPVVCDRFIISTLGYHKSIGLNIEIDIQKLNLQKPDFTFFLTIDNEIERQRRLKERNKFTSVDALVDNLDFRERLIKEYLRFSMTCIDTSNLSALQVVERIRRKIKM
jgi:dTMP kinase